MVLAENNIKEFSLLVHIQLCLLFETKKWAISELIEFLSRKQANKKNYHHSTKKNYHHSKTTDVLKLIKKAIKYEKETVFLYGFIGKKIL